MESLNYTVVDVRNYIPTLNLSILHIHTHTHIHARASTPGRPGPAYVSPFPPLPRNLFQQSDTFKFSALPHY